MGQNYLHKGWEVQWYRTFCYTDTVLQNVRTVLGHEISLRLEPWRKLSFKDMYVKIIFNIIRYPDVII